MPEPLFSRFCRGIECLFTLYSAKILIVLVATKYYSLFIKMSQSPCDPFHLLSLHENFLRRAVAHLDDVNTLLGLSQLMALQVKDSLSCQWYIFH